MYTKHWYKYHTLKEKQLMQHEKAFMNFYKGGQIGKTNNKVVVTNG